MTLIYFIFVLGATVFIHELGHFLLAKKAKIHCYEFSLGMGPRLFKFNRKNDETDYCIRLFPIGGFVSMAGEDIEEDESVPKENRLQSKNWFQKFSTMIAGIVFNFILAILIFFTIAIIYGAPTNVPYVGEVVEDSPSYTAGLQKGDKIVKINNHKTPNVDLLSIELAISQGNTLELEVLRNRETKTIKIEPNKTEEGYSYGFGITTNSEKGIIPSIKFAFSKFASLITQMVLVIWYLITGRLGLNTLSGPIGIFSLVGDTAKAGFVNIVYLLGIISVNVGFMNLLPIPAFDGGRILFLIIEKIKGRPISPKVENTIHSIGFALLMILMIVITYGDIVRLFK